MKRTILFVLLIIAFPTPAQISTDGTLGQTQNLPGPDYQIGADLGQQRGGNLFYSFQDFNLNSAESATFSGPNHIQNVISRVTGGNPSRIDGLFRSTIPGADVYFLNPYGIIFGPNARLDVQGSFHTSTADYLRFSDGERFEARNPNDSILTVAPIESFGFLTHSPAPLSVQGSQLEISQGKTFSLIGGNLSITSAQIKAPTGRINLASVAKIGDVIPKVEDFVVPSLYGDMIISENSLIETSGEGGGSIFIRSGQFVVDNSAIEAKTLGNQDGGVIDIQANTVFLTNGTTLNGNTEGTGNGTNISVRADESITVIGENTENSENIQETLISTRSGLQYTLTDDDLGDGGNIYLQAKNLHVKEGAGISASTNGGGQGGNITIKASDSVSLSGEGSRYDGITLYDGSYLAAGTFGDSESAGDAGNILIEAQNIALTDGSYIYSSTEGQGNGGNVTLNASQTLRLSGQPNSSGSQARINLDTQYQEKGAGDAGTLLIEAQNILLQDGSYIDSSTTGNGNAGTVTLNAENISLQDNIYISSSTFHNGKAGQISVQAQDLLLDKGAKIATITKGHGKGGHIIIQAETVTVASFNDEGEQSMIVTNSLADAGSPIAGDGGLIQLEAQQLLIKNGGTISNSSRALAEHATSGNAGTINIRADSIEITGRGQESSGHWTSSSINGISEGSGSAGAAGQIFLETNALTITNGGVITSGTNTRSPGGKISLQVNGPIRIVGQDEFISAGSENQETHWGKEYLSGIYATSESTNTQAGNAGQIEITADQITLSQGGRIDSSTLGTGEAGTMTIKVTSALNVVGRNKTGRRSSLITQTYSKENGAGQAGHIEITAYNMAITDGAQITSSTTGSGNAGDITLKVDDTLSFSGVSEVPAFGSDYPSYKSSYLYSDSLYEEKSAGNAGKIKIEAAQVNLSDGAQISSATWGSGTAGNLIIIADTLTIQGVNKAGNPSGIFNNSQSPKDYAGNANTISAQANTINLTEGGSMNTSTKNAGGGSIKILVTDLLHLHGGEITTSVRGGDGNGGNIEIQHPHLVLNNAKIIAQAYEGNGGNITLTTHQFQVSTESFIDASSEKGVSGKILINAPESDASTKVVVLSVSMLKADEQMQQPCSSRIAENLSSFVVAPREGIATSPDDLLPSGPHLSQIKPAAKTTKSMKRKGTTAKPHPQMAYRTGCQPASKENRVMPEQLF
jgi:filamentous hemagglutinin family protein